MSKTIKSVPNFIAYPVLSLPALAFVVICAFLYRDLQPASGESIKAAASLSNCMRTTIAGALDSSHDRPLSASMIESLKDAFGDNPRNALFTRLENAIYELEGCRRKLRELGSEKVIDSQLDRSGPNYHYVLAKMGQADVGLRISANSQQLEEGVHTYLAKLFDLADCVDAENPQTVSIHALMRVEQQWVKVRVANGACVVL